MSEPRPPDDLAAQIEQDTAAIIERLSHRLDQFEQEQTIPFAVRYPALAAWRARLQRREQGEDPDRSSTWRRDALWRAACWEARAATSPTPDLKALTRAREIMADLSALSGGDGHAG